MKKLLYSLSILLAIVLTTFHVMAQDNSSQKAGDTAIRAVLDAQRDAWNRGDIEAYMDGYDRSAETVFVSGNNVTHGWQPVLERYKKAYDSREKMGMLSFTVLEITMLGK